MLEILPDDYHTSAMMHCPQDTWPRLEGENNILLIPPDRVHIKGPFIMPK